jgi:hypothetical protein
MAIESCGQFFQVLPDFVHYPDQWFLNDPRTVGGEEIDARLRPHLFEHGVSGRAAAVFSGLLLPRPLDTDGTTRSS